MVAQYVFLILAHVTLQLQLEKWMSKAFNVIVKNTSATIFHGLYTFIDHRNDVKLFKILQ